MTQILDTLINGEPAENWSIHDRGFQYGDGLFETLAVVDGAPQQWDRHMQRLYRGAARLQIFPPPETQLRTEAATLCQGALRAVLKITLTRGISKRGYAPVVDAPATRVVSLSPWPDYPVSHVRDGVVVCFCRTTLAHQPALAGIKHLNRLEQVLARLEWQQDYDEGLMRDTDGYVVAGTMTNLFVVSHGTLLTPDLSRSGVEGVMRGLVIECANALSLPHRAVTLTQHDIQQAEEVFLTNSLIGLWPVRKIESLNYPIGKMTQQILQALHHDHAVG